jgi:hypothetical protein
MIFRGRIDGDGYRASTTVEEYKSISMLLKGDLKCGRRSMVWGVKMIFRVRMNF